MTWTCFGHGPNDLSHMPGYQKEMSTKCGVFVKQLVRRQCAFWQIVTIAHLFYCYNKYD